MHTAAEQYVRDVMRYIPAAHPDRERIERDLRSHIADRIAAGASAEEALAHMGAPEEVARSFMSDVALAYASTGQRLAAFCLDVGIFVGFAGLATAALSQMWNDDLPWMLIGAYSIASLWLLMLAYFPIAEGVFGQTIGKRVVGLCVVKESGLRIGLGTAIIRRIPLYFQFFILDALFVPFTRKRQRAFDMVAHTVVVRCQSV
jgi:uncharacterized RDD family membrane protein YckC